MKSIRNQLEALKAETKKATINLSKQSCEVDMSGFHIRQSFSYYDEEVYHIDKIFIDPEKSEVRVQLYEYADSIDLADFSIEDQIGIYEELHKLLSNPKYSYRIGCCRGINDRMLIISEIRGKDLENRFLPRFFLLTFCTLRVQNVLAKYPNLLTKFFGDVDQAKKRILQKHRKIPSMLTIC